MAQHVAVDLLARHPARRQLDELLADVELGAESPLELVYLRVSQINNCAYCLDMHTRDLIKKGQKIEKTALVQAWAEANRFADRKWELVFGEVIPEAQKHVAKELNLPQDKAQLMLDKMQPVLATRQMEQLQAASIEWANAARTDQEIGGERFQENLGVAKKAMEAYASPELRCSPRAWG